MALMRTLRRLGRSDSGAEIIELALVIPLLLVVVAGIIDFGFLFQRYEAVTNAAREGARVGILPDFDENDIKQRVQDYLSASGLTGTATPDVDFGTVQLNAPSGPTINVVTVTVSYPHDYLILGPIGRLLGGDLTSTTLKASSTMRREVAAQP